MRSGIITLLTDFGSRDTYVGQLKGVILGLHPAARLVDLGHAVRAQDVRMGALLLRDAWQCFPRGTVHLAVVDPGVGSERRALAVTAGGHFFVGPDNGLLLPAVRAAVGEPPEFRELTEPRFWRSPLSAALLPSGTTSWSPST